MNPLYFDDDATDEQIDHAINTEILPNLPELQAQEQAEAVAKSQQESFNSNSPLEKFIAGTGRGLMDIYEGLGQLGLEAGNKVGVVSDETLSNFNQNVQDERQVWDTASSGFAAGAGRFTGQFVPSTLIPGGPGKTALGLIRRGAIQGGLGGAAQFVGEDDSRLENSLEGGAFGAAGGAIGAAANKLIPKVINAFKGNIDPAAQEVSDLAKQFGVKATAGDLSASPVLKRTEQGLEYLPGIGMTRYRKEQADQVISALSKVVDKYKDQLPQADYDWLNHIKTAAAKNALGVKASASELISAKKANKILADIAKASNDPDEVIKVSAAVKEFRAHQIASGLYDKVEGLAGKTKVPTNNLRTALKQVGQADKDALLSEPEVARMVKDIQKKVDPPFKMKNGVPQVTPVKEFDYGQLRKARSDIKDKVNQLSKAGKLKEANALAQLRQGVEDDIKAFTKKSPNLATAQRAADEFYATKYGPIRDYSRKFFANKEADVLTDKGLNPKSADASQKFYSSLDSKGRAAVRYNVVKDAWDKAFDQSTNRISPVKFANHLEKLQESTKFFFKGQDKQEIQGLVKLLKHLERAGAYAERPSAPSRIAQMGVLGGTIGTAAYSWPLFLKTYGGAMVLKKLLVSKSGRNLLLAVSNLSEKNTKALNMLTSKIPAALEAGFVAPSDEEEPVASQ